MNCSFNSRQNQCARDISPLPGDLIGLNRNRIIMEFLSTEHLRCFSGDFNPWTALLLCMLQIRKYCTYKVCSMHRRTVYQNLRGWHHYGEKLGGLEWSKYFCQNWVPKNGGGLIPTHRSAMGYGSMSDTIKGLYRIRRGWLKYFTKFVKPSY